MTRDEIKELLPLYVAGSLPDDQHSAVKAALEQFPELRNEVRFWAGMRQATLLDIAGRKKHHPSAGQIVAYAEGTMHAGEERLIVEAHLQSCTSCREEVALLRPAAGKESDTTSSPDRRTPGFFIASGSLRPLIGIALIVLAIVAGVYMILPDERRPQADVQTDGKETASVLPPKADQVKRVALVLPLSSSLRHPGLERSVPPVLSLDGNTALVDIAVPVEHSAITAAYTVDLGALASKRFRLADSLRAAKSGGTVDTLRLTVGHEQFEEGKYVLYVREILGKGAAGVEPEEYRYDFQVKRTPPRDAKRGP